MQEPMGGWSPREKLVNESTTLVRKLQVLVDLVIKILKFKYIRDE